MGCEFICDGCGKRASAIAVKATGRWVKPDEWFERSDEDGIQTACSRACIKTIAEKTGKTKVVGPF